MSEPNNSVPPPSQDDDLTPQEGQVSEASGARFGGEEGGADSVPDTVSAEHEEDQDTSDDQVGGDDSETPL